MKVSIITATYNRNKTIIRAIKSIKKQIYPNIQLVVIDGESTDNTTDLVKPFIDKNDVYLSEKDDGIYDALNKGIKLATGEIIGFLHSDDMYFDNYVISKVVDLFDETVDIVYGDACFFSGNSIDKFTRIYNSDKLSLKNLAWGRMPAHPAIFIRKNIYESYGLFKTTYRIASDYEFLCRLMTRGQVNAVYLNDIFVKMQIGGISTGGFDNSILLNKEVLRACTENGI